MRRALTSVVAVTLAGLTLAGCSTDPVTGQSNPGTESSSTETTTRVPRNVDESDRSQVAFDPCLDLPDSALTDAGYDPKSEYDADFAPDLYTFLGCGWKTPQRKYIIELLSGNITFAEEQQKTSAYARPIEINGRQALLKLEPGDRDACSLSLETNYGILILARSLFTDHVGPAPQAEWCAGLEDTARIIEPYLPKGE